MAVQTDLRQLYRDRLSMRTRSRIARGRVRVRRPTAGLRVLPDFLVIGTMRGGTSSLYQYLSAHPQVVGSVRKEVEYFSAFHDRGERWYRQHFPLRTAVGRTRQAFEATPSYLFHPHAAGRAHALLPDARLIVLLRDPVRRARSHHRHVVRLGFEDLGFEEAVAAEEDRIGADLARMRADPAFDSKAVHRYSYLARGHYAAQLETWLRYYPRSQLLLLESTELYRSPAATFGEITHFLGLDPWQPEDFRNHSPAADSSGEVARDALDVVLAEQFAEDAVRLQALWGRRPSWV